jgi:hypothetical protein
MTNNRNTTEWLHPPNGYECKYCGSSNIMVRGWQAVMVPEIQSAKFACFDCNKRWWVHTERPDTSSNPS